MTWVTDFAIIIAIIVIIVLLSIRLRFRLLKMWKEVSNKDIIFHKILLDTVVLYYENRSLFVEDEYQTLFKKLARYRNKKLRHLLLKERQDLFLLINTIYSDIEDSEDEKYSSLQAKFIELQKLRRVYNTKVLLYNQAISVFPTRFLARKMELEIKEYFG